MFSQLLADTRWRAALERAGYRVIPEPRELVPGPVPNSVTCTRGGRSMSTTPRGWLITELAAEHYRVRYAPESTAAQASAALLRLTESAAYLRTSWPAGELWGTGEAPHLVLVVRRENHGLAVVVTVAERRHP